VLAAHIGAGEKPLTESAVRRIIRDEMNRRTGR
jgi:hypothetical protein